MAGAGGVAQRPKCQNLHRRLTEFLTLIRTKAFLVGIFLMPAFMIGSIVIQKR